MCVGGILYIGKKSLPPAIPSLPLSLKNRAIFPKDVE